MKFLVDEMPYFQDECPFYDISTGICKYDRDKCEHMYISSKERGKQTECRWLVQKEEKNEL